jgi:hypothetical protein
MIRGGSDLPELRPVGRKEDSMNREWMPVVAGVFEIVAAVCALVGGGLLLFATALLGAIPEVRNDPEVPIDVISGLLVGIGIFVLLLGLVSFIGGVFGIRRRGWGWTLAGSIAAVFVVAPAGILALVLTLVGEREFRGKSG